MPLTTIDVIDTAVKIGLGGLITGIATYYISRLNHNHEYKKEKDKRYFNTIEEVSTLIEESTHIALKYWSYLHLFIDKEKLNEEDELIHEEKQKVFKSLENDFYHMFKNITVAESRLMLNRLNEEASLLREYGLSIGNLRAIRYSDSLNKTSINNSKQELEEKRKKLFEKLAEAYNKY